jgi:hypothetical protein
MRYRPILLSMLLGTATQAGAQQISIYIGQPHASIGISFPVYPEFERVPNYPVYYAPHANSNVFFYDGLYWVYQQDRWYASTWYNGPWGEIAPEGVPYYVLRVPVRYYRQPPTYFSGWAVDAPPRWDQHWGATWSQKRSGWNQWNRSSAPAPAPLPVYQRQYSGDRYPVLEQQQVLQSRQYSYKPREEVVQQYYRQQAPKASASTSVPQTTRVQASAPSVAPGQVKNQQGAESAKEFAPGQVKKQQGAQSAKEFAPGQVKHNEVAHTAQPAAVAPQAIEPRTSPGASGKEKDKGKGHGQDKGQDSRDGDGAESHGQGQGKGKGHAKD